MIKIQSCWIDKLKQLSLLSFSTSIMMITTTDRCLRRSKCSSSMFFPILTFWLSSLFSFSSLLGQVHTVLLNENQYLWPSQTSSLYWKFQCNLTLFPETDGCHPTEASCDLESDLCICVPKDENEHESNELFRCLPSRRLRESCKHSAQCYAITLGSGCFRNSQSKNQLINSYTFDPNNDDSNDWKCSCSFGYKNNNPNQCETEHQENLTDVTESQQIQKCDQIPGYLWIPLLKRCIANPIHYSMRVGRAGGGRGGGRGGSVGRNTGSRAWFSHGSRNFATKLHQTNKNLTLIMILTLSVCFLNKFQLSLNKL